MEIGKKELNKILEQQREQYQRYLKMLSEDFDSKIKVIGEGQQDIPEINKTLKIMDEIFERMEDNIEIIKIGLKKKVDFEEFAVLVKRVAILENKLKKV